ncbi:MAG: hypothetical protein GY790_01975 [Bacteroidetes bacterium]|nr:hypothetical protein [Bacteroidota bacterium]
MEKYQYPEWQAGKIYTQLSDNTEATVFLELLESTGYDTVLNKSGSYTVFVPTDDAFQTWFGDHPEYESTIEKIPFEQREAMVQYHLLQNRWSREQMSMLGNEGWIDEDDPNNNRPTAYKRQSVFRNPDKKYWIRPRENDLRQEQESIVDSTSASYYRKVYTDSRKYLPLFFDEFFGINDLGPDDYAFYFDRTYQYNDIHIANGRLLGDEIPAENGFINMIDQVIIPPVNVEEYLLSDHKGVTTMRFLENMYRFSEFLPNNRATLEQPEAIGGGVYDTLFNLSFDNAPYTFPFEIHSEVTGSGSGVEREASTLRHHYGILIPTDQAFEDFVSNTLTGPDRWPDYHSIPDIVRWYILNTHMSSKPIYRSTLKTGVTNAFGETVELDESMIRETYYSSNATILLLDEMIESKAFRSITSPVLLQPGYSTILYALVYTNILEALGREGDFVYYLSSDAVLENDSSLLVDLSNGYLMFTVVDQSTPNPVPVYTSFGEVRKRILNQVGRRHPLGHARKEFIETLGGNYQVVDNELNTVSGGLPNTYGYKGDSAIFWEPELVGYFENGTTYGAETWFTTPIASMYTVLSGYPLFSSLLEETGLRDSRYEKIMFLEEGKKYTVFVPTDEALLAYGADTLGMEDLSRLLKNHFIKDELIWTHGLEASGSYQTALELQGGSGFESLELETGIDYIDILASDGSVFCHVPENGMHTNKMTAYTTIGSNRNDNRVPGPYDYVIKGVVHRIDKVLAPDL